MITQSEIADLRLAADKSPFHVQTVMHELLDAYENAPDAVELQELRYNLKQAEERVSELEGALRLVVRDLGKGARLVTDLDVVERLSEIRQAAADALVG